jgi:hypothetical protein
MQHGGPLLYTVSYVLKAELDQHPDDSERSMKFTLHLMETMIADSITRDHNTNG